MSLPHTLVLVRAKKDRDAIEHVLEKYYRDWKGQIQVATLRGTRDVDEIENEVKDRARSRKYVILLLGRKDLPREQDLRRLELRLLELPNVGFAIVRTAKIRNMRPLEIAVNIERAKALLRLRVSWNEKEPSYVLGFPLHVRGTYMISIPPHPLYDLYLVIGRVHAEYFRKVCRLELPDVFLVVKRVHDEHDIVVGKDRVVEVVIPENDEPHVRRYYRTSIPRVPVSLRDMVHLSAGYIKIHENIAISIMRTAYEEAQPDRVIVPWSGGKDSTACLILALRAFGKDRVVPVFVDTGLELDLNYEYIRYVSELLKISPEVERADIDRELDRKGLPTHERRWCTKMKIDALYRVIERISDRPLIVVGDRDNESLLRLRRPHIRRHGKYLQVAPIKYWSTLMTQLYLLLSGVPLNPLYMIGFYRIGCYICPAYRVWELNIAQEYFTKLVKEITFEALLREQSCLAG